MVLTRKWTPAVEAELQQLYSVHLNPDDMILSKESVVELCRDADVLCPLITDQIDEALINALPDSIKLIANFGVGVEHIDLAAASRRGIIVSNTPGTVVEATADIAFGLIIATARRFSEGERLLRRGDWEKFAINFMLGQSLHGKTLGIVGMGDIGQAVVRRAQGFSMPIIYHSRTRKTEIDIAGSIQYVDHLDALLEQADIVSLHCALTPQTHHLIDAAALAKMKSTALLINTSRGPVIDENALIEALESGKIAGAGLDVYENEPDIPDALVALDNVTLLPHLGTSAIEARDAMGFQVIDNIEQFLKTGNVIDQV